MSRSQLGLPTKTIGGDNANSGGSLAKITALLNTNTVEARLTTTSVIRSPGYYGHFFGCPAKNDIFLEKKPSLIRSLRYYGQCFFWPIGDRINGVPL